MNLRTFTLVLTLLAGFGISQAQPGQPNLTYPINGEDSVAIPPTFMWDTVEVDSFLFIIAEDALLSTNADSVWLDSIPFSYTYNDTVLAYHTTYYWTVQGYLRDTAGLPAMTQAFYTRGPAPTSPDLVSPMSASVDVSQTPTLVWTSSDTADLYHVWLSTYNGFADTSYYAETSDTFHTINVKLDANQAYYWKVAGSNGYGVGEYSYYWNFSTLYTSIQDIYGDDLGLSLYPNPTSESTTIRFNSVAGEDYRIEMLDMSGKAVRNAQAGTGTGATVQQEMVFGDLPSGVYLVRLTMGNRTQNIKLSVR